MCAMERVRCGVRYGPSEDQEADLHLPDAARPAVICLLHGGFWRAPYGRDQLTAVAGDLASHGLAVWNLEYSRLGSPRGGWPAAAEDVGAAVGHLARLADEGVDLDLERVAVVGHSAGGHLALCEAARWRDRDDETGRTCLRAIVGLAPIADLARAHAAGLGGGAVAELMGGDPRQRPEQYRTASPSARLPLGIPQIIVHGTADDVVPIDLSRRYARDAAAAGDEVELIELPGAGHMDYLDPASPAHAIVRQLLLDCLGG